MHKLARRIGIGIVGGALAILLAVAPVLAADNNTLKCEIKDNGRNSDNRCTIKLKEIRRGRRTHNEARIDNTVRLDISTGHLEANDNHLENDGDIDLKSGKVDITITITNTVNQ